MIRCRARRCVFLLCLLAWSFAPGRSASHQAGKFLIATDIHFNPFADPSLVGQLVAADAHQWETILDTSSSTAYSPYGEDTNWWLLQSTLDEMRATLPHPALVMVTGDLLAHAFPKKFAAATHDNNRDHYRAFVLKTAVFLGWQMRKRFPQEQVLVTPGNDDSDCGNYDVEADGPLLADTAALVQDLAGGSEVVGKEWKELGSYTVRSSAFPAVRILSLNSVFFSNLYQPADMQHNCTRSESRAGARTFEWLESQLAQARQAHQKVWLMMHIPPGIDGFATNVKYGQLSQKVELSATDRCQLATVPLWKPAWTQKFTQILAHNRGTIVAGFAGHDHTDDFRVSKAGFVLMGPPVSPVYGQNPGFRVVTVRDGGRLLNHTTFYLSNLLLARRDIAGIWTQEYEFDREWKSRQVDARSLTNLYRTVMAEPVTRDRWVTLLNVSSEDVHPKPAGVQALACAIGNLEQAAFQACYCSAAAGAPLQVPQK